MRSVRIGLLGPLEVRADGQRLEVAGARLRTLLILLALDAGRVVGTDRIVDGLWGDDPPAHAANALQTLVSRLRRALPGVVVESHPTGYRLAVEPDAVDVLRFERLATQGRRALADDPAGAAAMLAEAAGLWHGPALADAGEAEFAHAVRARLNELRLGAIEDCIDAELRLGRAQVELVAQLEALVAEHPLRERLVGLLMRALCAAGRRAEALAAYERLRDVLAERLGTDPSAELAALHVSVLREERARPVAPDEPPRTNLRAGLTSFVGRDEDLTRVGKLVGEYRLITLTGPGGAGKTRLAVESARTLVAGMPDGVWLVELAPVSDPAEVPRAVFAALGVLEHAVLPRERVPEVDRADPVDRLVAMLAGKDLLLVIDNCEHLVAAVAGLVDRLLGECPAVRVLATSREPLGMTGEAQWPVEPLALPPSDVDAEAAAGYAAVRLFADRAAAVRPGFAVDRSTVDAVVRICRALDGIPLAIELAAARLSAMAPEQVAGRLDDRFRLLTRGSRTALPRHQTLRAVVDWSWELLGAAERALLRRLSVFSGGATLEAAERVCAGDPVQPDEVLDLATALVDKSLLVTADDGRYRMLETIRAYAREQLAAAGEAERVRRAHAAFFLELTETAEPHLRTGEQLAWLPRLDPEHDNLHDAVRGAIAAGDTETALRMIGALAWYWWLRGHRVEGTDLAAEAMTMPGEVPDVLRAMAYVAGAVNGLGGRRDFEQQLDWFRRAVELTAHADTEAHARYPLLRLLGPMSTLVEQWGSADAMSSLAERFDDADPWVRSVARFMYAQAEINLGGATASAEVNLRAGLEGFRVLGERWGISASLAALADLTSRRGDHTGALAYLEEAVALLAEVGSAEDGPEVQGRLGLELWLLGERDRAWAVLADALRRAQRVGLPEAVARVEHTMSELARVSGDLTQARNRLERVAGLTWGLNAAPQMFALIAGSFGCLATATGDLAAARRHHAEALDRALASTDMPVVAQVLVGVADLALAEGDLEQAARLLGAVDGIRGGPDHAQLDAPRVTAAARAALGEPAFTGAYERGRATTADGVRALAGLTPDA